MDHLSEKYDKSKAILGWVFTSFGGVTYILLFILCIYRIRVYPLVSWINLDLMYLAVAYLVLLAVGAAYFHFSGVKNTATIKYIFIPLTLSYIPLIFFAEKYPAISLSYTLWISFFFLGLGVKLGDGYGSLIRKLYNFMFSCLLLLSIGILIMITYTTYDLKATMFSGKFPEEMARQAIDGYLNDMKSTYIDGGIGTALLLVYFLRFIKPLARRFKNKPVK